MIPQESAVASTASPSPTETDGSVPSGGDVIGAAVALAADAASAVDRGEATGLADTFARFAEAGALAHGLAPADADPAAPRDLRPTATLLRAVAAECMSTAFSLWAHRMVVEYVTAAGGAVADGLRDELVGGRRLGSIAMATALKEVAGLGAVPTTARPDGQGGYIVDGTIAWASNIDEGTLLLFPARVVRDDAADDSGERVILTALIGSAGLTIRPAKNLLALGATRSAMLVFDGLVVPAADVLADSLSAARAQRAPHLLLQTAFCLGLADRSLAEAAPLAAATNGVIAAQHRRLAEQRDALSARLDAFAEDPAAQENRDVTLLRYEAARLAGSTVRLESALVGGRGYVTTSGTNRRLREASFLPVQSPSEVQLLTELEAMGVSVADGYQI